MSVTIKTPEDIEKMRVAGRLAAEVLEMIAPHVKAGVTTEELDKLCHDHIVDVQGAVPANVGYKGFPKTVCTSVNHVICHGIPTHSKVLKDGDIINIDVTVIRTAGMAHQSHVLTSANLRCWPGGWSRRLAMRC